MAFKIRGQVLGATYSILGGVTVDVVPDGTFRTSGALANPDGYSAYIQWMETTGVDTANSSITYEPDFGQQYDGPASQRVMRRATGTTSPYRTAQTDVLNGYVNDYLENNSWAPLGYLWYPMGLYYGYAEDGHAKSLTALQNVPENTAWSRENAFSNPYWEHQEVSRETAYALLGVTMLERITGLNNTGLSAGGYTAEDRYVLMLNRAENHLYSWRFNDYAVTGVTSDLNFMNPFMVSLTCYALGKYYDNNVALGRTPNFGWPTDHWATIPDAIEDILTWMMDSALVQDGTFAGQRVWIDNYFNTGNDGVFRYKDRDSGASGSGGADPAPDLNFVIAPAYAWVGKHTNSQAWFLNRADKIFNGGAQQINTIGDETNASSAGAALDNKRFNQQLYWMGDFFDWRNSV